MTYNFLKTNIANTFGLIKDDTVIMNSLKVNETNKFTLGHNFPEFKSILNFLATDIDCMILNGFMGCGKTTLVKSLENILNSQTLFLKVDCFKATTFDDILLSLNAQFRYFYAKKKITLPKTETNNFKDKINHYIETIQKPFFIFVDSFENIEDSNCQEILEFFAYLAKLKKVKILFSARSFNSDYLDKQNLKIEWGMISPYNKESIEIYLKENNVEYSEDVLTGLLAVTKGYFLYLETTLNILNLYRTSLDKLLAEYTKKQKGYYDEFIFQKILSLIPSTFSELIWFLTISRIGVSEDVLKQFNFIEKDELNYLIKNKIAYKSGGVYGIKSYLKDLIIKNIPSFTKIKINKFLKEFYESQLPLKPTERVLNLSRTTMRNEITYHDNNIKLLTKEKPKNENPGYVKTFSNNNWVFTKVNKKPPKEDVKPETKEKEKEEEKTPRVLNQEQEIFNNEIAELASKTENSYEYTKAIKYFEKELKETDKADINTQISLLLKIAHNHEKLHNWQKTIYYLEKIYEIYADSQEYLKADFTLFKIANIYKEIYNYNKAKMYFSRILNSPSKKSNEFLAQCKITLADMKDENSQDFQNAVKLYNEALEFALKDNLTSLICEIYFKLGLLYDDNADTDTALKYYMNNIQTSIDIRKNENLSSSYANIAIIYLENRQASLAIDYLNKSLEIDLTTNNYDGQYFVYTKLAWIYFRTNQKTAFQYMTKAKKCAEKLKDDFYIASANLEIGDFYYNLKQDELALKYYIIAEKYLPSASAQENSEKIEIRMRDIRQRQGLEKYNLMLDIIKNAKI